MLLQFQFYLDPPEGHRMAGETFTYDATTVDIAVSHAEAMLWEQTFSFGEANLCIIKDKDGKLVREVRSRNT